MLSDDGVVSLQLWGGISSTALRALFENCHSLIELFLGKDVVHSVSAFSVRALDCYYPSLTVLKVMGTSTTRTALRDIFTYCTNLREVDIRRCRRIDDEAIM